MGFLATIIIGFIVGVLARFLKPGNDRLGVIMTTILGIVGAMLAAFLGRAVGWYAPDEPAGFFGALLGAIILLYIAEALTGRRRRLNP